jgi:phage terminase large subunit-like protein
MSEGITMVEVRQGYVSMSGPMKEIEKLLLAGKIRHGGNPVLRWMVSNCAVMADPAGNKKPAKNKSNGRIDGVVAMIVGFARAIVAPPEAEPAPGYLDNVAHDSLAHYLTVGKSATALGGFYSLRGGMGRFSL